MGRNQFLTRMVIAFAVGLVPFHLSFSVHAKTPWEDDGDEGDDGDSDDENPPGKYTPYEPPAEKVKPFDPKLEPYRYLGIAENATQQEIQEAINSRMKETRDQVLIDILLELHLLLLTPENRAAFDGALEYSKLVSNPHSFSMAFASRDKDLAKELSRFNAAIEKKYRYAVSSEFFEILKKELDKAMSKTPPQIAFGEDSPMARLEVFRRRWLMPASDGPIGNALLNPDAPGGAVLISKRDTPLQPYEKNELKQALITLANAYVVEPVWEKEFNQALKADETLSTALGLFRTLRYFHAAEATRNWRGSASQFPMLDKTFLLELSKKRVSQLEPDARNRYLYVLLAENSVHGDLPGVLKDEFGLSLPEAFSTILELGKTVHRPLEESHFKNLVEGVIAWAKTPKRALSREELEAVSAIFVRLTKDEDFQKQKEKYWLMTAFEQGMSAHCDLNLLRKQ